MGLKQSKLQFGLTLAVDCIAVATLLSLLGEYNQVCEILSHFVLIYCIALLTLMPLALVVKNKMALIVGFLALLPNVARLAPQYETGNRPLAPPNSQTISLISFNCENHKNNKPDEIYKVVTARKADIVFLSEIDKVWQKRIQDTFVDYPYKCIYAPYPGIALLSKEPLIKPEVKLSDDGKKARIVSSVRLKDNSQLFLQAVHPGTPLNPKAFNSRNNDFDIYAEELATAADHKIMAGDINCTPWSYYFQRLLKQSGMVDSENGFGPQCSWSLFGLFIPMLPIDHCLLSPEIIVTDRQIEKSAGSDHRPVYVQVAVPLAKVLKLPNRQ